MKLLLYTFLALVFIQASSVAQSDYTPDEQVKLTEKFSLPFPTIWKTIKKIVTETGCSIETDKQTFDEKTELYKGTIRSEACVIANGEDSTRDILMKFSKVPMIRAGVWTSGRIQYNFFVKDIEAKQVQVVLTAEVSGREDYITHLVHTWYSNGEPERKMMERLNSELAKISAEREKKK